MLVNLYDNRSARLLAQAGGANATGPRSRSTSSRARVIDVGGGWNLRSWRSSVRLLADRGTVTALAVRTLPTQRHLTDAEWEQISRRLARQAGLGKRPWLAVRTSSTTVALLTDSTAGPPKIDAARDFIRTVVIDRGLRPGQTADPEPRVTFLQPQPTDDEGHPSSAVRVEVSADSPDDIAQAVVGREELTDKGLLAAVSMNWERMAASPDRGNRITMAASLAWNHTYTDAFERGYEIVSKGSSEHFAQLQVRVADAPNRDEATASAVRELFLIARGAMPIRIETPEVPRNTMMVATRAGLERPADQTIPEAIVRAVCREAAAIGGRHGALAATADIQHAWQAHRRSLDASVVDSAVLQRIDSVFTELHQKLSDSLAAREEGAGPGAVEVRSSFAAPPGTATPPVTVQADPVSLDQFRRSRRL
ncbi:hypothetical protein GCM10009558_001500 [Virgisporangium aurantiacum]